MASTLLSGSISLKRKRFVLGAISVNRQLLKHFFSYKVTTETDFSRVFCGIGYLMFVMVLAIQLYFLTGDGGYFN